MEIYIDDVRMDTDERTVVSLNLAISSVLEPEKNRTGYTDVILLPLTENNRKVTLSPDQVNSAGLFNRERHTARIEEKGCVVIEGVAIMLSCSSAGGPGEWPCIRMGIVGSGKAWADRAAATMIRALGVDFEETVTPTLIRDSWTWERPIRFLPVQRDGFPVTNPSGSLTKPVKVLAFEDYHPFLHLRSLLDVIFAGAGYRLRSDFMDGEFFRKLHISGNYPAVSNEAAKSRMDFRAGRFTAATAAADSLGRVYADPYIGFSSVGNLVESADSEKSVDGEKIPRVFDSGGCFKLDDGRIAFVPLYGVNVAFEYRIHYTTDYYLESRAELLGFNSVNLDDGQGLRRFALANRYADRRGLFVNRMTYTLVVFGHTDGDTYRFAYTETTGGNAILHIHSEFSSRTASVVVSSQAAVADPQLFIRNAAGAFVPYDGDWALYDGYVQEYGTVEVELRLRSSAERVLPSSPKYFDSIIFGGARPGMNLTLGTRTTIRPVFTEYPTLGSRIAFTDVAAQDFTCLDLIRSVRHLFNLRFYTDEVSKNVYAEPYDDFYVDTPVTDWSDKLDRSRPVVISQPSDKMAATLHYSYRTGDGAVTRRNRSRGETLGKWTVTFDNNLARESEQTVENGIFTASVNAAGDYPDAPSASLLQAGDRDLTLTDDLENLNFLPKIVVYEGMRPLPEGERWGWPSNGASYPYLAFHHSAEDNGPAGTLEPFTLCFEDRDGITGLHRHRDKEIGQKSAGRRVEAYLDLSPADIEALIRPNGLLRDFRGLFRLTIGGETALYRLEEIAGYSPGEENPTRGVFLKEFPVV